MPCGKGKGICPADVEGRLNEYSETTQQLVIAFLCFILFMLKSCTTKKKRCAFFFLNFNSRQQIAL